MGGDFQQYRANVYCQRPDCPHASTFGKNVFYFFVIAKEGNLYF